MSGPELLNRHTAIPALVAPNGRKYKAELHEVNPSLWTIQYDDNKRGELPEFLTKTVFTSQRLAEAHLLKFLNEFWDKSDDAAQAAKRQTKAA
jgi:hypothetical protein